MSEPQIKAIKTTYNGILFNSRLEARWAYIFDQLNLSWMYEPEGFESNGQRYLPDFYIKNWECFVEVKNPVNPAKEKYRDFALNGITSPLILLTDIRTRKDTIRVDSVYCFDTTNGSGGPYVESGFIYFCKIHGIGHLEFRLYWEDRKIYKDINFRKRWTEYFCNSEEMSVLNLREIVNKAKSKRFYNE